MFKLNTANPPEHADEFYNFITPICSFLELNPCIPLNNINYLLYDSYRNTIFELNITPETIINFLKDRCYLIDIIKNREYLSYLYNQPIVSLIYYFICISGEVTKDTWMLTQNELITLFTDLGISSGLD